MNDTDYMSLIAKKVYDPENCYTSVRKKALYGIIYYLFIRNFAKMPYNVNREYRINLDPTWFLPLAWQDFFSKVDENFIYAKLVRDFMYELDDDFEQYIKNVCRVFNTDFEDIDEDKNDFKYWELKKFKQRIFSKGNWLNSDWITAKTFEDVSPKKMQELCKFYNYYCNEAEYDWKKFPEYKRVDRPEYNKNRGQFNIAMLGGKIEFLDEFELMQFSYFVEFSNKFLENKEFGGRQFKDYGFLKTN